MPRVHYGLAAAAAVCLLGGVAFAQADTSAPPSDNAPPAASATPDQSAPNEPAMAPASQGAGMSNGASSAGSAGAETSAQVSDNGTQVVASQPVPDTPANRAKYGQPMSRAGKHTAPAGN